MGYYSEFTIGASNVDMQDLLEWAEGHCDDLYEALTAPDERKWYAFKEDMALCSKAFPRALFTVRVMGEDAEKPSFFYFHDGKMQEAKVEIVVEPYNPDLLREVTQWVRK